MKRIGAVGLAAVVAWAGFYPTHAQNTRVNGAGISNPPEQSLGGAVKRAMTFADLMAMKRVSDPQISPSGRWVLFSVTDVDLEKNTKTNHLWVVPLDGSAPEHEVTTGPGESFGRFSPDGRQVSWTQMPGKDEAYARIAVAAWDEKTGAVGAAKPLTGISGDADGAVWSPDSKKLMFTTEVYPECSVKSGVVTEADSSASLRNDKQKANTNAGVPPLRPSASGRDDGITVAGVEIGGTNNVAAWRGMQPAAWADEDACDRAKDEAAEKNPVKAQVWDGLLYRHWDQFTGAKRTHIIEADFALDGANPRDVTTARDVGDAETPTWMLGGPQEYAWAPDSKEIAYVTDLSAVPAASTNNDVFTLRVDDPNARPVKVSTSAGSDDEPEYSPDGRWLAFRSQRQAGFESDRERLKVYDREKKTTRELMPKFGNWVDEFTWAPDSSAIHFASPWQGEEPISRVNLADGIIVGESTAPPAEGEFSDLRVAPSGKVIVATRMLANEPAHLLELHLDQMAPVDVDVTPSRGHRSSGRNIDSALGPEYLESDRLTHLNDGVIKALDLSAIEPFSFKGAGGSEVEGFLLKPPGFDPAKKYPLKFIMHGGPQTMAGDSWSYRWNWELMAASGYVVIGINRRGSTGYGQKFVDEVSGDWGGRAYEDLMKGLDYAEAKYPFIDKTRECALGASYGGFMADWVLTHTNRFKCIVTHDGLYDAGAAWGATEEMWFPEWEFRRPEDYPKGWDGFAANAKQTVAGHAAEPWRYAGLPAKDDPFRKWSPKEYIQNAKTPTLIIHSQRDYRLDVSQGFELYTALQRLNVPSRFLYFPDEGHWVLKPRDSELWNAVVSDWCDRWTQSGKYAEK